MIPVYVNSVPARCLVDSGASHCICSGEFYRKLLKKKEGSAEKLVIRSENRELLAADNSRMPVSISFDAEIKINGLAIPITFDVVDALGYDCLVGVTFLKATEAVIDLRTNTRILYDGLVTASMTRYSNLTCTVYTASNVIIPAYSECVFPVSTFRSTIRGEHIIEGSLELPSRTLLGARALVDATRKKLPCRVLNPSDKAITLRAHTPIGELSPVTLASVSAIRRSPECRRPSIGE